MQMGVFHLHLLTAITYKGFVPNKEVRGISLMHHATTSMIPGISRLPGVEKFKGIGFDLLKSTPLYTVNTETLGNAGNP